MHCEVIVRALTSGGMSAMQRAASHPSNPGHGGVAINKSSLPSPHHSLASNLFLFTVGLSKHVRISVQSLVITKFTKSCKPSHPYSMISKTSAQHMPPRLDFSTTRSVSHSETQGRPSELPGTTYIDTTPLPHPR